MIRRLWSSPLATVGLAVLFTLGASVGGSAIPAAGAEAAPVEVLTGTPWTTDFNGDSNTTVADYILFVTRYICGQPTNSPPACVGLVYLQGDYDCDGFVFITDYVRFARAYTIAINQTPPYFESGKCP